MKKKKRKIKAKAKRAKKVFRFPHKAKKKRKFKARKAKKRAPKMRKARKRAAKKRRAKVAPVQKKTKTKKFKTKGKAMAKRKRSKSRKSKKGFFGSQRGSVSAPPKKMIMRVAQKLAHGVEGVAMAKITSKAISMLPITSPKIKAGIQVAAGLAGSLFTDSRPWLKGLSDGPFYIGSAALAKGFGVDTMAGEEDYILGVDEEGNVREMSADEVAELNGNFAGDESFAMRGNFNGDDGDDMDGGFDL